MVYTVPEKSSTKQTKTILLYVFYNACILVFPILTLVFWTSTTREPLLFSFETGQWLSANQKYSSAIWTASSTGATALLLFLLNQVLYLMAKQNANQGRSNFPSGWSKCANHQPLWDIRRWRLSTFTVVNWLVALALTTAFTTLFTPTKVIVNEPLVGDELDFQAPEFWKWYETRDEKNQPVRKIGGCTRYTYTSSTGSVRFPTCPFTDDPVGCISAGLSAVQETLGVQNTTVRVADSVFRGSTGGILPLGPGGIAAFSNVAFQSWDPSTTYPLFNYTLAQQGLSAAVSCQETPNTPIQRRLIETINVTNAGGAGNMQLSSFRINTSDCRSNDKWLVSTYGTVAPAFCQPDPTVKKYQLYLAPSGKYANLPNLTCSIEPVITRSLASYSRATGLLTQQIVETVEGSLVPNETAEAVKYLSMISITSWGNGLIDSILSLNTSGDDPTSFSYPAAVEAAVRGFIEYEGTNLRMYYTANEAPGRSPVTGNYTVVRVGYSNIQPTALAFLLSLLGYVLLVAVWYTCMGLKTGSLIVDDFDPTNNIALVAAAAAGGGSGKLAFDAAGGSKPSLVPVMGARVRHEGREGLVIAESDDTSAARLLVTEVVTPK
ncbi:fungal specific transcription factor domain-containing protein [Colletotrichum plurivorum]|uniref:Fungal specific transcription factor domain-containing protein n=1 Tax=Colletotrichum plurivorum TaxID=2175906 RepID=A0A8H6KD50_9PEZI|nr:fungal specific transcription factor domain-containing protein [Colletotrichum plurivorum]